MNGRRRDGRRVRSQQIRAMAERILALRRALEALGGDPDVDDLRFVDWVAPRRATKDDGQSWEDISAELSELLGVQVSRETARRWYLLP